VFWLGGSAFDRLRMRHLKVMPFFDSKKWACRTMPVAKGMAL
jgi:hypothetical protein